MPEAFDYSIVDEALAKCGAKQSSIIAILQTIQERYHYLPEEVFPYLAAKLDMSEARASTAWLPSMRTSPLRRREST